MKSDILLNTLLCVALTGFGSMLGKIAYNDYFPGYIYGGICGMFLFLYIVLKGVLK
jgi:hypothetical protein